VLNAAGNRLDLEVDRQLVSVATAFDRLLAVTPVNTDEAWAAFAAGGYADEPVFRYRPLGVDLDLLQRRLSAIPVEDVEDPTLAELFAAKRGEVEVGIRLVGARNTDAFLPLSLALYGGVEAGLVEVAKDILTRPRPGPEAVGDESFLDADAFAARARQELAHYRRAWPDFDATVEIRDDVPGVMCAQGRLLVSRRLRLSATRREALVHHEVGTHLVTHCNGATQPLSLLQVGLAGAEETQEGLAVLAEYLVGGLTPSRLILLAARVVAVERLLAGARFAEAFDCLHSDYGFEAQRAFRVAMRVYRSGGLTKDAIYLRGLGNLLRHLGQGGSLEGLLVGKLALECLGLVSRLLEQGLLEAPPLEPRWLSVPGAAERLERLGTGMGLRELWEEACA
jgi:uncharacterized protein (TIGR02421 family)